LVDELKKAVENQTYYSSLRKVHRYNSDEQFKEVEVGQGFVDVSYEI